MQLWNAITSSCSNTSLIPQITFSYSRTGAYILALVKFDYDHLSIWTLNTRWVMGIIGSEPKAKVQIDQDLNCPRSEITMVEIWINEGLPFIWENNAKYFTQSIWHIVYKIKNILLLKMEKKHKLLTWSADFSTHYSVNDYEGKARPAIFECFMWCNP